jgi:phage protein D
VDRGDMSAIKFEVTMMSVKFTQDQLRHVSELVIDESDSEATMLRMTYQDIDMFLLNNEDIISKGAQIEVRLGYEAHCPLKFKGNVSIVEVDYGVNGIPSVVIVAIDSTNMFTTKTKTRKFTNTTASAVISSICKEYGFKAVVTATTEIVKEISQEEETDAQLFNKLADNEGFVWYIMNESTLFFGSRFNYNYQVVDTLGYNIGNYGIISFQPMRVEKSNNVTTTSAQVDSSKAEERVADSKSKITNNTPKKITVDAVTGAVRVSHATTPNKKYSNTIDTK